MRKRVAAGLAAIFILLILAVAGRHELLRFALEQGAGFATGYRVAVGEMRVGWAGASFANVRVARGDRALLDAARITVHYSLRDLFPGSTRRFGLRDLEVNGAKLTLIRFKDGSFNFNLPHPSPRRKPERVNPVPLRFTVRVRDSQIDLLEPAAYDPSAKEIRVANVAVDASIDTAALTEYRARAAFLEARPEPFEIRGRIDAVAGYAMHRATAPIFPARALANYLADTNAVRILGGRAQNFDARIYALGVVPDAAPSYHVSLKLDVSAGRLALRSLAAPVEKLQARLNVIDNAFFVRDATASLAGLPLTIEGGAYDLTGALTGHAQLRLGVWGRGDLSALRQAFAFARGQPISGGARLGVLVNGRIDDPVIVARVNAERAFYRALPFESLAAAVVYHSNVIALAPVRVAYGGIAVRVDGTMTVADRLRSKFAVHVEGPASRLPYLDEMLGAEPIAIDASATGTDLAFHIVGSAASARGVARLAALVETDPNGTATVAPFWLHTERGNLDGGYVLDRPNDSSAFWMLASGLKMKATTYKAFPGISLPEMPPVNGRNVGMAIAGGGSGRNIVLAGVVGANDAQIAGVAFDRVQAAFGGNLQSAAVNRLSATGPWGAFSGRGAFSSQRFVAYGKYRGTFEGLHPFLGDAIAGHGALAGTVGIGIEPQRIVVQGSDLAMRGATLHGIPIDRADLTLAVEGSRLRVYSAQARAAGGELVAAGTFALSPSAERTGPNAVALVTNRLVAAQLRGIGLPLDAGTLTAAGTLGAGAPIPTFKGSVAIDDGRMGHFAVTGNGDVRIAGNAVALDRVLGAVGKTYADVDGSIDSLTSGSPVLALSAKVPAAQIAPTLHAFDLPNYMTDGSFNARLRIAGPPSVPTVSGDVNVPAGEVNGLPFVDASALLSANPHGVAIRNGSVLVGTTRTQFTAISRPHESLVDLAAPHADLSDFNNFFDTGDTLDGNGRLKLAAASIDSQINSSGNIDVRGFRYRNLPIGDTRADWSSSHNTIDGSLAVGGSEGMLRARGSIAITRARSWQSTLIRSRFNLRGSIDDLDLSLWLPALGMQSLPVTGRASGEASIVGRYPNIDVHANARLAGGTIGPLGLERAAFALHSARRRLVIDDAELTTSALSASASGSMGLRPNDPLDVRVHASTDRLAELIYDAARIRVPIRGSFESTLSLGGTYRSPSFAAGFDGSDIVAYGLPITSLFGEIRVARRALVISNAGAAFTHGEATLAGSLPLQLAPLRFAPPEEPISFDLDVVGLDPAIFETMLGNNTKLAGVIDGHLGISGSIDHPAIVGSASLANGSYSSDLERVPITQIAAALAFNRTAATLQRAFARFGSGTVQGQGTADFPNGLSARGGTLSLKGVARGAQLDLPAYGSGTLDAALSLQKRPGSDAILAGKATLSNATLAFAGFVKAAQQSSGSIIPPLPLAFDLQATAGRNVRVRGSGYGAGLDIGVAGSVNLGGSLVAPTLAGTFDSTGGTLTYFDRAFRVQQGSVSFTPADGVLPVLHAVATTSVVNPDPDRARNPYGSADVTIRVDGPIAGLRVGLSTNPPGYTQDQILALIAPLGGFVGGIGFSRQGMLAQQQPSGITPFGAVSPIPSVALQQRSTITVGQEAFNLLNAQFTAGLLSPFETTLGQALGLSSVNLTLGYYGNVGFTASRLLGKAVSVIYAVTFGIPQTQSFGLAVAPNPETSVALNFFVLSGPTKLVQYPSAPLGFGAGYLATEALIGNSGFSLTYQRHFW